MHRVGQAWLALAISGDALVLGAVTALQFLPILVIGPWAGVLADRVDRRRLLMATQVALGLQALALGALVLSGSVTTAVLMGAAALLGVITAVDAPARQSIVSDLVPRDQVVNAVSLNGASFNAARLLGPAIAGMIIAAFGTGWVFLVNAATFIVMLIALAGITTATTDSGRASGGIRSGMRHVRERPDLLFVIALAGLVSMFALNSQITTATMSTLEFGAGPVVFGILGSVLAVGSLAGSLLSARRGRTDLRIISIAALALSTATVLAGLAPNPWFYAASLALCGITALTMMTAANSYLQTRSDPDQRSRVMSLYLAVFFGTTPLGAPLVGWFTEVIGPRAGLVIPGLLALTVAGGLLLLFRRRVDFA